MLTLNCARVVLGGESQERILFLEKVSRPPLLLGMLTGGTDEYNADGEMLENVVRIQGWPALASTDSCYRDDPRCCSCEALI